MCFGLVSAWTVCLPMPHIDHIKQIDHILINRFHPQNLRDFTLNGLLNAGPERHV